MKDGAWCAFIYFHFNGDENTIKVLVCGDASGAFSVSTAPDAPQVAVITVCPSNIWTEFSSEIKLPEGIAPLYFTFTGEGSLNFYAFSISSQEALFRNR